MGIPISTQHSVPLFNPLRGNFHVDPLGLSWNVNVTNGANTVAIGKALTHTNKGKKPSWDSIAQKFTRKNFLEFILPMKQTGNVAMQSYAINININRQETNAHDISTKSHFVTTILDLTVTCGNLSHNPSLGIELETSDEKVFTAHVQSGTPKRCK